MRWSEWRAARTCCDGGSRAGARSALPAGWSRSAARRERVVAVGPLVLDGSVHPTDPKGTRLVHRSHLDPGGGRFRRGDVGAEHPAVSLDDPPTGLVPDPVLLACALDEPPIPGPPTSFKTPRRPTVLACLVCRTAYRCEFRADAACLDQGARSASRLGTRADRSDAASRRMRGPPGGKVVRDGQATRP